MYLRRQPRIDLRNIRISNSRIGDAVAVNFSHKQLHLTEASMPHVDFRICDVDMRVLHCAHQIVHQAFAIAAEH